MIENKQLITEKFILISPQNDPATEIEKLSIDFADISDMISEAIVAIDFQRQVLLHIPNHHLATCGLSPELIKTLRYDFFKYALHPNDFPLWIKIYNVILTSLTNGDLPVEKINYFACTLRIRSFLSKEDQKPDYLMVYVKLKPKWLNGVPRFGICLFSPSIVPKSGNLCVFCDNQAYFEYSFKEKKWELQPVMQLTKRQKEVLVWSHQGLTQVQIADKMKDKKGNSMKVKTIEKIKNSLFRKLGVYSIEQAIQYSANRRLLYHLPSENPKTDRMKKTRLPPIKKRNRLTADQMKEVQNELDRGGKTVNAIAREKSIPESEIRYHIQKRNLFKKSQ